MAEKEKDTLRITNQFRSKGGMVYDMRQNGERLTVIVSPSASDKGGGDWHVQAKTGTSLDADGVERSGATPLEALRAVGLAWTEQLDRGWPRFDWEAVAQVLMAVRAV